MMMILTIQQMEQEQSLDDKMQRQDELIMKLRNQESKLGLYINEFHQAIAKKKHKINDSARNEDKTQRILEKELETAKVMLKNYQNQLRALTKNKIKNEFSAQHLVSLDEQIQQKEQYLKELQQDIKNLTIIRRKQEKVIEKKQKNQDGLKLAKLVQDIRKQRDHLEMVKMKHKQAEEALEKRKAAVMQLQQAYIQKCRKNNEQPLSFEQFKQKRSQQCKEKSVNKSSSKEEKKKQPSVREIINGHLDQSAFEPNQKTLLQLQEKKAVAENSLKIARKKYDHEINELKERLEELKGENQSLQNKLVQKKKERDVIELERNKDQKRSAKAFNKLDPISSRMDLVQSKLESQLEFKKN